MRNNRGIQQAVKHNLGKGTFRIRSGFELLNQAQSKLSEHIQVLLDGTIYDCKQNSTKSRRDAIKSAQAAG